MNKKQLVIQHDLSKLTEEQLEQYKRDVSAFIGLDPDLNGLDTIWMENEHGPGKSLVLYARRGTAEILRENNKIEVSSLTSLEVRGSIVFTATGKNYDHRQEIATGSKSLVDSRTGAYLSGKALDNAIMTASTRALRRLTMQFTKLGILDESEIDAVQGSTTNPAASATLAGSPVVLPPIPQVPANNGPGRDVTTTASPNAAPATPLTVSLDRPMAPALTPQSQEDFEKGQQALRDEATRQLNQLSSAKADINADIPVTLASVTPVESPVTGDKQLDTKAAETPPIIAPKPPRRPRKARNTVSMDGPEAEIVSNAPAVPATAPVVSPATVVPEPAQERIQTTPVPPQVNSVPASVPTQANPAVPTLGTSVPNQGTDFSGKPTAAQMGEYRKRVSVYTSELPSSENMGSVQKMRAFITKMSGAAPQFMTTDQWEEMLGWFEQFVAKNQVKGLVKYINDSLGVK